MTLSAAAIAARKRGAKTKTYTQTPNRSYLHDPSWLAALAAANPEQYGPGYVARLVTSRQPVRYGAGNPGQKW